MNMRRQDDDGAYDDEGNRHQRREWDGIARFVMPLAGTAALGVFGWGVSVEVRLGNIQSIQAERAEMIGKFQARLEHVEAVATDPAPKPESKVQMDAIDSRVDRLEERLNYIHAYILALPVRPPPPPMLPSKRGDLRLEDFIKGAMDSRLN